MALVTLSEIDRYAAGRMRVERYTKKASAILNEDTKGYPDDQSFDVFLSHSYHDAQMNLERLLGANEFLESFGLTVYVDWIIDKQLNRDKVNANTAATLRNRMDNSRCLFFATSESSHESIWMPWELGYMDGQTGRVAIFPLAKDDDSDSFEGQEYLGMYPYIDAAIATKTTDRLLWVNTDPATYIDFENWLQGTDPYRRR